MKATVVLVVEDDAETLKALKHLLAGSLGFLVIGASSGREALDTMDKGLDVDVVLSKNPARRLAHMSPG